MNLENIDIGIVELLSKKYKIDKYRENSIYYNKKINLDQLKKGINYDYFFVNELINTYLLIETYITPYDIDIINLIIKYIIINSKFKVKKPQNYSLLENIYYYIGFKSIQNTNYRKTIDYHQCKNVNIIIKDKYIKIFNTIIIPYSESYL